jgi:hypothetical protein
MATTAVPTVTDDEIIERGKAVYESRLKSLVEPEHIGKYIAIDVETGDYEIDRDDLAVEDRLLKRHPDANLFLTRVGAKTAYSMGCVF